MSLDQLNKLLSAVLPVVLHGELREILYTAGNAFSKNEHVYKVGDVSWTVVLNESEWHEVKNNDSSSRAVSLHIYFKPTDKNQVFGEEEPRTLEHISEKGKPKDTKCLPLSDDPRYIRECYWETDDVHDTRTVNRLECLYGFCVPKERKVSALRERLFLIAAVISFVIALVALLLVTLTIKNEQENTVSSKSRFEICLNCSLLFLPTGHPVEREITITYSSDTREKCCAENEQELSILMDLILNASQVRTNEELSSFTKEKLPISAHKRLMQTNLPGQGKDKNLP
uniref:Cysteine dioxygenase n=1 Tax=Biomphalaria glabrata TaxID=6526 RepID=A0A2C9LZ78_BIOGL